MTTSTRNRIAQIVVMAAGIVVLAIGLLIEARDVTRVAKWSGSGFTLCAAAQSDSITTFFTVDPNDFVSAPYPQRGDTILTIADSAATLNRWIASLEVVHTPGREVKITFLRKGVEHETVIRTRPVSATLRVSVFILQILKVLIFLSFVGLGFWAYLKRPDSPPVRVLALYGFSMATFMVTTFMPMYAVMAAFQVPLEGRLLGIAASIGVFFSGFWLLLQMLRSSGADRFWPTDSACSPGFSSSASPPARPCSNSPTTSAFASSSTPSPCCRCWPDWLC